MKLKLGGVTKALTVEKSFAFGSWDGLSIAENAEIQLRVEYRGDVAFVSRITWIAAEPQEHEPLLLPDWVTEAKQIPALLKRLWRREERRLSIPIETAAGPDAAAIVEDAVRSRSLTPRRLFAKRLDAIEEHARIQRFFFEIDKATKQQLTRKPWSDAIRDVRDELNVRNSLRVAYGSRTVPMVPGFDALDVTDPKQRELREQLVEVSAFFRWTAVCHLYRSHASGHTVQHVGIFDWAFEQFATDGVVVAHREEHVQDALYSHGAPDGPEFFKFGELALFCLENSVDERFWRRHLASLVRAAHVFVEHASEPGAGIVPSTPSVYGFQIGRVYPMERRIQLRAEYAGALDGLPWRGQRVFLEDRFTSIMSQTLMATTSSDARNERELPQQHAATLLPGGIPVSPH